MSTNEAVKAMTFRGSSWVDGAIRLSRFAVGGRSGRGLSVCHVLGAKVNTTGKGKIGEVGELGGGLSTTVTVGGTWQCGYGGRSR